MKRFHVWLIMAAVILIYASRITSAQSPATVTVQRVIAAGFSRPVAIANAGDGSNRLFIVEKAGKIKIIKNGVVLPQPFLDLSGQVSSGGEQGLLGLAFHPQFQSNGLFFVYYTDNVAVGNTVVARFKVSSTNPDAADPNSKKQILYVVQPFTNHNGGTLVFGPDEYLYIGLGDGGSGGDPQNNAQSLNTLLGKILRIDINTTAAYIIPPDNPFVKVNGAKGEIWAYGLRNPWKFRFDRVTGDLYIGDVGQNQYEEVNFLAAGSPAGVNYGWPCLEGTHTYSSVSPCNNPSYLAGLTLPVAEYSHSEGISVTGGVVYRGSLFSDLRGRYYYADFGTGRLWSLFRDPAQSSAFSPPVLELANTGMTISTFGEGEDGEVYLADYSSGAIHRLESVNGPTPELGSSTFTPNTPTADRLGTVTFTIMLKNTGAAASNLAISNPLPAGLSYAGELNASAGTASESGGTITWNGGVPSQGVVTIRYNCTVNAGVENGSLLNRAVLSGPGLGTLSLTAELWVPKAALATTPQNFHLPGTQPGRLNSPLQTSVDCDICHSAPIYDRWRGSVMSQAGRDPLMWSALAVSNAYAPGSGEFCLRCHTNKGWLEGRSSPANGSALTGVDLANGVACLTCHRMVDVIASPNDEAHAIDALVRSALDELPPANTSGSAMLIIDPSDNRRGPFSLASTFPYHTAKQTDLLGQAGSAETRSRLCGNCHNVRNPFLSFDTGRNAYWPNPDGEPAATFDSTASNRTFPLESTFDEWRLSAYARGGVVAPQFAGSKVGGVVETCQDCHMPRLTGKAADDAFNPILRDCRSTGCLPEHSFAGANTWLQDLLQNPAWRLSSAGEPDTLIDNQARTRTLLSKAAALTVTTGEPSAGKQPVTVTVVNQTGHKLPTGYPEGRRMWINLRAYDASGNLVYESGAYNFQTGVLTLDPAIKVYEAKLGLSADLASVMKLPAGESFFFSLNNIWIKDNRIPPRGYTQAAFNQDGLRPVGTVYTDGAYSDTTVYSVPVSAARVVAVLYHQAASKEYIDFLRQFGGVDGNALGGLWDTAHSDPVVVARSWTPIFPVLLPVISR